MNTLERQAHIKQITNPMYHLRKVVHKLFLMINATDNQSDQTRVLSNSNHIKDFNKLMKNQSSIQVEFSNQQLQNYYKVIFHKETYKKKATKVKDRFLKKINCNLICKTHKCYVQVSNLVSLIK